MYEYISYHYDALHKFKNQNYLDITMRIDIT